MRYIFEGQRDSDMSQKCGPRSLREHRQGQSLRAIVGDRRVLIRRIAQPSQAQKRSVSRRASGRYLIALPLSVIPPGTLHASAPARAERSEDRAGLILYNIGSILPKARLWTMTYHHPARSSLGEGVGVEGSRRALLRAIHQDGWHLRSAYPTGGAVWFSERSEEREDIDNTRKRAIHSHPSITDKRSVTVKRRSDAPTLRFGPPGDSASLSVTHSAAEMVPLQ